MIRKLIAIDDGHGMTTAGKRTPFLPGTKKYMHENEFNRAVADLLKSNLERCGFNTLMVAPGDSDVPLKQRTDTANNAKADLYISIHANALNGIWGNQQGVSTYHYPGSVEGKKAATIIHKYMIQGTQQKDRKVLSENFHVLRETNMPSVLVECAFMDNLKEAGLLMSEAFRQECADEIAKGICEYFGVMYSPAAKAPTAQELMEFLNDKGIISDTAKWLKKGLTDNDVYWLMRKMVEYIKKG
jgi:N-acetylmuramoyl-L-alanine amidase